MCDIVFSLRSLLRFEPIISAPILWPGVENTNGVDKPWMKLHLEGILPFPKTANSRMCAHW